MALVSVVGDGATIVEKRTADFLDWVSLGINLIGVIPVPPSMAATGRDLNHFPTHEPIHGYAQNVPNSKSN